MKKQLKSKEKRVTIAAFVLGIIKGKGLAKKPAKDCAFVVAEVKRHYPGTKFSLNHLSWYLSRYRRQQAEGLGTDRLHELKPVTKHSKKPAKHGFAARKAKKAAKKVKVEIDETN